MRGKILFSKLYKDWIKIKKTILMVSHDRSWLEIKQTEYWRYVKMLFVLLAKDLKLEIRSKEIVPSMFVFGLTVILVFALSFSNSSSFNARSFVRSFMVSYLVYFDFWIK